MTCQGTTESLGISRSSCHEQSQPCSCCHSCPIWCNTPTYKWFWKKWLQERQHRWRQLVQPTCGWWQRGGGDAAPPHHAVTSWAAVSGLFTTWAPVSVTHLSAREEISLCMDSPFCSCSTSIYNGTWSIFKMPLCSKMETCNYVSLRTIITTGHGESG